MSVSTIKEQLVDAGLHEESVNRMIEHYQQMRFHLGSEDFVEAGAHVGNFCENVANLILDEIGEGASPHVNVGTFVDRMLNGQYDAQGLAPDVRKTVPRMLRAAYDIRNNRDSVHMNLEVPVNRSDTQTAVRISSWVLTELLYEYGDDEDIDIIAETIDALAAPLTPYIDTFEGSRIVMSEGLSLTDEILVHLHLYGRPLDADNLAEWIIGEDAHSVKSTLGNLKQQRKVHYEEGVAKITSLGSSRAEQIIDEQFEDGIQDEL